MNEAFLRRTLVRLDYDWATRSNQHTVRQLQGRRSNLLSFVLNGCNAVNRLLPCPSGQAGFFALTIYVPTVQECDASKAS